MVTGVATVVLAVSAWSSNCVEMGADKPLNCGVPMAITHSPFEYLLPTTELKPGEAKLKTYPAEILATPDGELRYELRIWEVLPIAGPRYYQAQFEWLAPARSTCILSVDASKAQWSPLTCIAYDGARLTRYGALIQTKGPK